MQQVGEFEKVRFSQFQEDAFACGVRLEEAGMRAAYDALPLPKRATLGSAGYDLHTPFPFTLAPGESITIPTGLRTRIDSGWWLAILPRSGQGFTYRLQLDNTVGVIDSDYYFAENQGHVLVKLTNDSRAGKSLVLEQYGRFAQAVFLPYGITRSDAPRETRTGGLGSTDRGYIPTNS